MKKMNFRHAGIGALFLFTLSSVSLAQSSQNLAEKSLDFAISAAKQVVTEVQKHGRPFAEGVVKNAPASYKATRKSLADFAKKVEKGDIGKTVIQQKELLLELWRMRGAINVMSFLDPKVLKSYTGLEVPELTKMKTILVTTENRLKKLNFPGV
jgi:hypothetical protein